MAVPLERSPSQLSPAQHAAAREASRDGPATIEFGSMKVAPEEESSEEEEEETGEVDAEVEEVEELSPTARLAAAQKMSFGIKGDDSDGEIEYG